MNSMYAMYPKSVTYSDTFSPLQNVEQHLYFLKNMSITMLHILPFLKSPHKDSGYDISGYYDINSEYGNLNDLTSVINTAKLLNISLFMDLVFNHVSNEHEWFKAAVTGSEYYRNFFIHSLEKPKIISIKDNYAEYDTVDGIKKVFIFFPEEKTAIPHWEQYSDGYWYYHTFYSFQIDLNWNNEYVVREMKNILIYWTKFGFNFRFDAALLLGGLPYKNEEIKNYRNFIIFQQLRKTVKSINNNCLFLPESSSSNNGLYADYFNNGSFDLSFNFKLCSYVWLSFVSENSDYIRFYFEDVKDYPNIDWLLFLRNHDELNLDFLNEEDRKYLIQKIKTNSTNKLFRSTLGISGTTFSFTHENILTYKLLYLYLFSLPGKIMIPTGDEFGKINVPMDTLSSPDQYDTRNINRGTIYIHNLPKDERIQLPGFFKILFEIKNNINYKKFVIQYQNIKELFTIHYGKYIFMINLSSKKPFEIKTKVNNILLKVNKIIVVGNDIIFLHPKSGLIFT